MHASDDAGEVNHAFCIWNAVIGKEVSFRWFDSHVYDEFVTYGCTFNPLKSRYSERIAVSVHAVDAPTVMEVQRCIPGRAVGTYMHELV